MMPEELTGKAVRPGSLEGVIVRATTHADLPSLVECLNPVFLERRYLAIVEAIPAHEAIAYHGANIDAGHPHCVALDGARVVGICDVAPAAPPRIAAQAHVGALGMLLAADYRGRGIGERLLRQTLAACHGKFERVQLNVYSHNARAHRLYLRCGFAEEGRLRSAWKLDGMTSDIIEMGILLT